MQKDIFIMVSGPAACGKSTLVKGISQNLPAFIYSPSKAYLDLAKEKCIPLERAFYDINSDDAKNYFCNKCREHQTIVGDQHLAIQHHKDSQIACNSPNVMFLEEPYVSAIDYDLFDRLTEYDIKTLLIYLKASPEILYERAHKRFITQGTFIRNHTIEEVIEEVNAEEYYFNQLINRVSIESHVIDTDYKEVNEVLDNALRKTLKFRR